VLNWVPDHVRVSAGGSMGSADGAWKIAADMATNDAAKP
jgi:hypothetical protein